VSEQSRIITGLPRRSTSGARSVTGDLSALRAKNRSAATAPQQPTAQVAEPQQPEKKPGNKAMTTYVSPDVLTQARLAFRATRTVESDRNWSHFVEKAIAAETRRRASLHNDRAPFTGEDSPLSPGRPLADD
jgi:hypothetical protein